MTERATVTIDDRESTDRRIQLQTTRGLLIIDAIDRLVDEAGVLHQDDRSQLVCCGLLEGGFEPLLYLALLRYQAQVGSVRQRCQDLYAACVVHVETGAILTAGSWKDLDTNDKARERWMQLAVIDSYETIRTRDLLRELELQEELISAYLEAMVTIQRRELAQLGQH